jgi:catechol 2,3-dioxygenase-like lactoylglutathione lyase family enzyme
MTSTAALTTVAPILCVVDLQTSLEFYTTKLGFRVSFQYDDYAGLTRDGIQLHLAQFGDRSVCENTSCYIYVTNIDALYEEYRTQGVIHPNGALERKPWGVREFVVLGVDGNRIRFGEPQE